MIPHPPGLLAAGRCRVCPFLEGTARTGFPDVASRSPSWCWERERGSPWQGSAEKPEMGAVGRDPSTTEQLCSSQEFLSCVPVSLQPLRTAPALRPGPRGLPPNAPLVVPARAPVCAQPSPGSPARSGEVALKSGCISRTLPLLKKLSLLPSAPPDGLHLEEELLNFSNKVPFA